MVEDVETKARAEAGRLIILLLLFPKELDPQVSLE